MILLKAISHIEGICGMMLFLMGLQEHVLPLIAIGMFLVGNALQTWEQGNVR